MWRICKKGSDVWKYVKKLTGRKLDGYIVEKVDEVNIKYGVQRVREKTRKPKKNPDM